MKFIILGCGSSNRVGDGFHFRHDLIPFFLHIAVCAVEGSLIDRSDHEMSNQIAFGAHFLPSERFTDPFKGVLPIAGELDRLVSAGEIR